MSVWKPIRRDLRIPHHDMMIVRKPNNRGGYNIELAYKSKEASWRVGNGATSIYHFTEWTEIPE
jgi:hypothetical protein